MVDTVAGDPKVLQADAEMYYEKLLKQSSSAPDVFSIPGGEKVISCCFSFYKLDIANQFLGSVHSLFVNRGKLV